MQEGEIHRREVVHDRPECLVGREELLQLGDLLVADVPGVRRARQGDGQLPARMLRPTRGAGTTGPPALALPLIEGAAHQVREGVQPSQEAPPLAFKATALCVSHGRYLAHVHVVVKRHLVGHLVGFAIFLQSADLGALAPDRGTIGPASARPMRPPVEGCEQVRGSVDNQGGVG